MLLDPNILNPPPFQPDNFLRFRAMWLRALSNLKTFHGRREFVQFLSLQKLEDLLLW